MKMILVRPIQAALALCLTTSMCMHRDLAAQSAQNTAVTSPAPVANPKYAAAIAEAKDMVRQRKFVFAMDAYRKANKIAGGRDLDSLGKLYDLELRVGDYKAAITTASTLTEIATTPAEKSAAEVHLGTALLGDAGDKNKPEKLQAAEAAFKAAVLDNPKNPTAHFLDGKTLARLNQTAAAGDQFKQCVSCMRPNDPAYMRAQHFAENPELSTHKMAPPVTVTALDGSQFNLDNMTGRVVLIDFWATWCGPCNEELPHMKKIAAEFAGQPLVIISVSWDSDEAKWKDFVAKHEMTWVQYRDADHSLSTQFGINSIPHYFTIDADGVLTSEMIGSGSDVEGKLKKLLAKAKQTPAKPAPVATGTE